MAVALLNSSVDCVVVVLQNKTAIVGQQSVTLTLTPDLQFLRLSTAWGFEMEIT